MPIIAKTSSSSWENAPEGLHQGVCVDVVDLGDVTTEWGTKHKVELRWQIDSLDSRGKRYEIRKRYTLSLHEKARLRQELQTWRGRKFTEQELGGFDLEKLIGVNCQLQIVHNLSDEGRTYANVQAIVSHNPKAPKLVPLGYVRQQDRQAGDDVNAIAAAGVFEEEAVPFAWMVPFVLPLIGVASAAMAWSRLVSA